MYSNEQLLMHNCVEHNYYIINIYATIEKLVNPGAAAGRKIGPAFTCANCRGPKNRPIDKRAVCNFTAPRTAVVR